jgi:hypothetical protein
MAGVPDVLITEFTDPACPWAYSAEPFRQHLRRVYGDRIEWQLRMVVLSESAEEIEAAEFGVKQLSSAYRTIAREHGMPDRHLAALAHGGVPSTTSRETTVSVSRRVLGQRDVCGTKGAELPVGCSTGVEAVVAVGVDVLVVNGVDVVDVFVGHGVPGSGEGLEGVSDVAGVPVDDRV